MQHLWGNGTTDVNSCTLQKFHINAHINVDDFIADLQWETQESGVWEGGIVAPAPLSSDPLLINCQ